MGGSGRVGDGAYLRDNRVKACVVLAKRPTQGRHHRHRYGVKRRGVPIPIRPGRREPWLLASRRRLEHLGRSFWSIPITQRMCIEQSFRDTTDLRAGAVSEARI